LIRLQILEINSSSKNALGLVAYVFFFIKIAVTFY